MMNHHQARIFRFPAKELLKIILTASAVGMECAAFRTFLNHFVMQNYNASLLDFFTRFCIIKSINLQEQ